MGACCNSDIAKGITIKEQLICTSEVYPDPHGLQWYEEGLLIPHEMVRSGLNEMCQIFETRPDTKEDQKARIMKFREWYHYFYTCIHHHHDTEETLYFPAIEEKMKLKNEQFPKKLAADHVALLKMMDHIKTIDDYDELQILIPKLCAEMKGHLKEEESIIPGCLKNHMSEEENNALVDEIIKSMGLSGNKMMLPWLIDSLIQWKGLEGTQGFVDTLPYPIRKLYFCSWQGFYLNNQKRLIKELLSKA